MINIAEQELKLKGNSSEKREKAIMQVVNNDKYFDINVINDNLAKKFKDEGINIKSDEAIDVMHLLIDNLEYISSLMASESENSIKEYIRSL